MSDGKLDPLEYEVALKALDSFKRRVVIMYKNKTYTPEISEMMITTIGENDCLVIFIAGECFG